MFGRSDPWERYASPSSGPTAEDAMIASFKKTWDNFYSRIQPLTGRGAKKGFFSLFTRTVNPDALIVYTDFADAYLRDLITTNVDGITVLGPIQRKIGKVVLDEYSLLKRFSECDQNVDSPILDYFIGTGK